MIRNIFPESNESNDLELNQQYMAYEYDYDIDKNEFILVNGRTRIVTGAKAVKIWIYKTLSTERYNHLAYSFDYGQEYSDLIGMSYQPGIVQMEAERLTKEAIFVHPAITELKDFQVNFNDDELKIKFIAITIYGEIDINL